MKFTNLLLKNDHLRKKLEYTQLFIIVCYLYVYIILLNTCRLKAHMINLLLFFVCLFF